MVCLIHYLTLLMACCPLVSIGWLLLMRWCITFLYINSCVHITLQITNNNCKKVDIEFSTQMIKKNTYRFIIINLITNNNNFSVKLDHFRAEDSRILYYFTFLRLRIFTLIGNHLNCKCGCFIILFRFDFVSWKWLTSITLYFL